MSAAGALVSRDGARRCAGLYVHYPFCSAICPYCDFAVVKGGANARSQLYAALRAELELIEWPFEIDTIYFGGGTPSLLAPDDLAALLAGIRARLRIAPSARVFLEANPEDVNEQSVAAWRTVGVRFLSLGIQSLDADELRFLGRRHTSEGARVAARTALGGGFETVSIDLMFGLPGQTPTTWRRNLAAAVALAPQHISCYQLTVKKGTRFGVERARGALVEMPDDEQGQHFELTHEVLESNGYRAYEVSNFARAPQHESAHNTKYWDHTPYLGLGPSAHSFDGRRRWWNARARGDYEARLKRGERPIEGSETLERRDLALEEVMLRLRTTAGIDLAGFTARHGIDLVAHNRVVVERGVERGHLQVADGRLRATRVGLAIADALAAQLRIEE
ncbi:MAG: radical SAM family heme chaperone HemW [Planctomycetota bacterium]